MYASNHRQRSLALLMTCKAQLTPTKRHMQLNLHLLIWLTPTNLLFITPTASFTATVAAVPDSLIAADIHTHNNALVLLYNVLNNALCARRKNVSLQSILQKREMRLSKSTAHNTELSSVAPLINELINTFLKSRE
jgi:hypothetical protein